MKTISNNNSSEIIINKSRFICELIKVYNTDDVTNNIEIIKSKYKDATHYCYSYIIDNTKRFSDDGEPGGTAGLPILNVLENNDLNYTLAVVIRYFGGIKLGAGGLVRAYTKSVSDCLNKTPISNIVNGYSLEIEFNYDKVKLIDNSLKDIIIKNKQFNETIIYNLDISKEKYISLEELLNNNCININTSNEILIEEKN